MSALLLETKGSSIAATVHETELVRQKLKLQLTVTFKQRGCKRRLRGIEPGDSAAAVGNLRGVDHELKELRLVRPNVERGIGRWSAHPCFHHAIKVIPFAIFVKCQTIFEMGQDVLGLPVVGHVVSAVPTLGIFLLPRLLDLREHIPDKRNGPRTFPGGVRY